LPSFSTSFLACDAWRLLLSFAVLPVELCSACPRSTPCTRNRTAPAPRQDKRVSFRRENLMKYLEIGCARCARFCLASLARTNTISARTRTGRQTQLDSQVYGYPAMRP